MSRINLGRAEVELDAYASQANAVLGIRGAGKTYSATYIAERLLDAGIPITVLDPIGMWRFLRVPGAGKGYPVVVAGGEHGDIPLPPHGAAEIVRAAMRDGVSIVFDLYDAALSKRQWRDIVEAVVKTMLYENKAHGLRHVFIEEAAEFVPQRIRPDQGAVYDVVERLARMGGNAQLGLTLINQRAEEVNKAVLDLCDLLILHRQKGRNSLINLGKWMDVASVTNAANIKETVPGLKNGEAFIWPAESDSPTRTKIPEKHSYHPDRKAMHKAIAAEAKRVDVGVFVATMKGSLERLTKEAEQNDPKLLRAEIARLKRNPVKTLAIDHDAVRGADAAGYTRGRAEANEQLEQAASAVSGINSRIAKALGEIQSASTQLASQQLRLYPRLDAKRSAKATHIIPQKIHRERAPDRSGNGALSKAGRLILTALAQQQQPLEQDRLAILAGYAVGTGHFNNTIGALRSAAYVSTGWPAEILPVGLEALGQFEPLPTGRALLEWWCARLSKAERAILLAGADAYPKALSKPQLAQQAGYEANTGHFNNSLGRLRTMRLLEGRSEIRMSDSLA